MIVALIKSIVEALPLTDSPEAYPTFVHGEKEFQNFIADEIEGTLVFLDAPITSNDRPTKGGYIEESYPISMLFLAKSELDYTPEQHQVIIQQMRALRRRFINRLQANANVREVNGISTIDVVNIFDVNLSGVIYRLNVIPFNTDTACQ